MVIKKIKEDKFLQHNLIYFVGTVSVAFLNYLYHPIMGRIMKVADFGEIQAFLSFLLILGVFTGFFKNVITTIVANLKDEKDRELLAMLQKFSLICAFFLALILVLFGNFLASFFNFSSYYFFPAFALLVFVGVINTNNQAITQGLQNFKVLSLSGILGSLSKLILSVLFVFIGWAVFGVIGAIILSSFISCVYLILSNRNYFKIENSFSIKIDSRIKKELWYAFVFLIVSLAITFLYSSDVVIIKKYFSPEIAGFYSGMAIIGRIIYFLVSSIPAVLLPSIKLSDEKKENKNIMIKAMILTTILGGGALAVFSVFPGLVTKILIGERYHDYAFLLPKISLYLFFVSFSSLFFYYFLALRKNHIILPALAGPLTVLILCYINHSNVEIIVNNFLIGSLLSFFLLLINIIKELFFKKDNGKQEIDFNSYPSL
ncbi:MAG: oligosaccharide flippase family protein [Candidatus Paceibacterota bacterium]